MCMSETEILHRAIFKPFQTPFRLSSLFVPDILLCALSHEFFLFF